MATYKEQNKLNVPHLRFSEFQGEWEKHGLSEYLDFKNGLNPDSKRFGKGIKFISVMDILNNPVITYDCIRHQFKPQMQKYLRFLLKMEIFFFSVAPRPWKM